MKILIFNWRDIKNPKAGGSELYFHEMAKRWIASGNKVSMICGGWKNCKNKENVDGVEIIRVGSPMTLYALSPVAFFKMKEEPDIIIDVENGIPFFTQLFVRNKKIFLHIHHVHKGVWFKQLPLPLAIIGWFIETKIMPRVYQKVPILTISESSKKEIENEKLGKVIGVINPGINFAEYKKYSKNKKPVVLFLNRIKKYKGLDVLLQAVKEIKKYKIDLEIWIAGGGDKTEVEKMKKYVLQNDLNNVKFLGKISEEKKAELMQKAWIFVNPSFKEGWGIVNIESNYFGTPVIGSNVSGIKDSIVDGKTGLLFEYENPHQLAEKIKEIILNKRLRKKMELNSKNWSKKFDFQSKAKEYLGIIENYISLKKVK